MIQLNSIQPQFRHHICQMIQCKEEWVEFNWKKGWRHYAIFFLLGGKKVIKCIHYE